MPNPLRLNLTPANEEPLVGLMREAAILGLSADQQRAMSMCAERVASLLDIEVVTAYGAMLNVLRGSSDIAGVIAGWREATERDDARSRETGQVPALSEDEQRAMRTLLGVPNGPASVGTLTAPVVRPEVMARVLAPGEAMCVIRERDGTVYYIVGRSNSIDVRHEMPEPIFSFERVTPYYTARGGGPEVTVRIDDARIERHEEPR